MTHNGVEGAGVPHAAPSNHGRTVAAWVTNIGITLGALVAAVGVALAAWVLVWIGSSVVAASLILGGILKALGHGQPKSRPRA